MRIHSASPAAHRLAALAYQARHVADGLCRACPDPAAGGVYCERHRAISSAVSLARYYRSTGRTGRRMPEHVRARLRDLGKRAA